MKWLAGAIAGAAVAAAAPAQACSPPPVPNGADRPPATARVPPQSPVVIRVVALGSARFPATTRARILAVMRGPYRAGQVIRVQPTAGSACGRESVERGQAGLVYTSLPERRGAPLPLPPFWPEPDAAPR